MLSEDNGNDDSKQYKRLKSEIDEFFGRLDDCKKKYGVTTRDRVWTLDECGFQIGRLRNGLISTALSEDGVILPTPQCPTDGLSGHTSELTVILEIISSHGKVLSPLMIYNCNNQMEACFPQQGSSRVKLTPSFDGDFANSMYSKIGLHCASHCR